MNLKRTMMIGVLTCMALLACSQPVAWAEDTAAQINSANQALVDGKIDEALAQYDSTEQLMPGSPLLAYNKGIALYRQGKVEQARQSFTVALDTDDPELAAKASFNLGNCLYANAVQQSETDRPAAIKSLQTAIAHYRSALQSNPADTDARTNIELAQQLMQKLLKEQEQQEQEQQKQDQQKLDQQTQKNDQNSENQDQSDSSDSKTGKSDDKKSDNSKSDVSQSDQQEKSDESKSDESKSDQSESDQSKSDESKSDKSKADQQKDQQGQSDKQNSAGADPSDQKPDEPQDRSGSANKDQPAEPHQPGEEQQQPQPQPGEEQPQSENDQPPGQAMNAGQGGNQDQQGDGQQVPGYGISQQGEPGENINKEEAMKMLQAIRDRDLMRRMQKLNETRRRYRPVDRDW